MLDEDEWTRLAHAQDLSVSKTKSDRFAPMLAEYNRITGFNETNPNAVFHHRLSIYGPPCKHCSKPLRTPQAKLCEACMTPVH